MQEPKNPWQRLSSKTVYENPWLRLREDSVIRPDGSPGIYSVLELPESATIAAIDSAGMVAMVRQWRYTHNRSGLELPSGGSSQGESPLEAAQREMLEETGLSAGTWEYLGAVENSNGATTDLAHLYVAKDLVMNQAQRDATEHDLSLVWLPLAEATKLAYDGEIRESTTVALLMKIASGLS